MSPKELWVLCSSVAVGWCNFVWVCVCSKLINIFHLFFHKCILYFKYFSINFLFQGRRSQITSRKNSRKSVQSRSVTACEQKNYHNWDKHLFVFKNYFFLFELMIFLWTTNSNLSEINKPNIFLLGKISTIWFPQL